MYRRDLRDRGLELDPDLAETEGEAEFWPGPAKRTLTQRLAPFPGPPPAEPSRAIPPYEAPLWADLTSWSPPHLGGDDGRVAQLHVEVGGEAPGEIELPQSTGAPLQRDVRAAMERSFGADFTSVRVHQSDRAGEIGAEAFAYGEDIYFAPGRFEPGTEPGRALLGHELAHVVQQRAGRVHGEQAFGGRGVGVNADPALEAEADAAGALAARGERVSIPGAGAGPGGAAVQRKIVISGGRRTKTQRLTVAAATTLLEAEGVTIGDAENAVLETMSDANEPFRSVEALAAAVQARVVRGGPAPKRKRDQRSASPENDRSARPSDAKRRKSTTSGGENTGGTEGDDRTSSTAAWSALMAALLADLAEIQSKKGKLSVDDRRRILQSCTSVLLHKAHIASFLSVDPVISGSSEMDTSPTTRQEQPYEQAKSGTYFRSQADGHTQQLYKDGIGHADKVDKKKRGRAELRAPYNERVYELIWESTGDKTKAKSSVKAQFDEGVTTVKKGHKEPIAGHLGLRTNNADVVFRMIDRLLASKGSIATLIAFLTKVAKKGTAPAEVSTEPLGSDKVHEIFDQIVDLTGSLGSLYQDLEPRGDDEDDDESSDEVGGDETMDVSTGGSGSGKSLDPMQLPPEVVAAVKAKGHCLLPYSGTELLWIGLDDGGDAYSWSVIPLDPSSDAHLSASPVTRKLGQASERADRFCAMLEDRQLAVLRVARQSGNPQVTIHVPLDEVEGIGEISPDFFMQSLRVYLASLVTRHAVESGQPLAISQRQSFGFLDSSLADTGPSIRLSIGTEPFEFLSAVADAVARADEELAALLEKDPAEVRRIVGPKEKKAKAKSKAKPKTKPLASIRSPNRKLAAYFQAISAGAANENYGLEDFLDYVGGKAGDTKGYASGKARGHGARDLQQDATARGGHRNDGDYLNALALEANKHLSTVAARSEASEAVRRDLAEYELPIIEPLNNVLVLAGDIMRSYCGDVPFGDPGGVGMLEGTRRAALLRLGACLGAARLAIGQLDAHHDRLAKAGSKEAVDAAAAKLDQGIRARVHLTLRNATEDVFESLLALLSTFSTQKPVGPEQRVVDRLDEALTPENGKAPDIAAYRTDSGEQAAAIAMAALRREALGMDEPPSTGGEQASSFSIENDGDRTYYELAELLGDNAIPAPSDGTPASATVVDPRPYLTTVPAVRDTTEWEKQFGAKVAEIQGQLARAPKGVTRSVMVDVTNIDYMDPAILAVIDSVRDDVLAQRLRFVLFNSGVKHEQLGMDKYQVGRLIVIGKALPALQKFKGFNENPLIQQLLGMLEDLRDNGGIPDSELGIDPMHQANAFATRHKDFTGFMAAIGNKDWSKLVADFAAAAEKKDDDATIQAASNGFVAIEQGLAAVTKLLTGDMVPAEAYAAFNVLPSADQDEVRERVLRITEQRDGSKSGSESGGKTGGESGGKSGSKGGARGRGGPGTGIENMGNTCYLAAGLNLLATSQPYYAAIATPNLLESAAHQTLRARLLAVLDLIRAGTRVTTAGIEPLLQSMAALHLLPPPSAAATRMGQTAEEAQHDPSEVIFRKLLPALGMSGAGTPELCVRQSATTDFSQAQNVAEPADQSRPERYTSIDAHPHYVEHQDELMLDLAMPPPAQGQQQQQQLSVASIMQHHMRQEWVDGVKALRNGRIVQGDHVSRQVAVTGGPRVLSITFKRTAFLAKDTRPIDIPEVLPAFNGQYQLQAVIHHHGQTLSSGHYTADTRNGDGSWSHRDDTRVTPLARPQDTRQDAYMITYQRLPDQQVVALEEDNGAH